MVSRIAAKWRWYDWIVLLIVVLALIKWLAPDTGLHNALHVFFHWLAIGVAWIGNALAAIFNVV